jgi:hypothetical protein
MFHGTHPSLAGRPGGKGSRGQAIYGRAGLEPKRADRGMPLRLRGVDRSPVLASRCVAFYSIRAITWQSAYPPDLQLAVEIVPTTIL